MSDVVPINGVAGNFDVPRSTDEAPPEFEFSGRLRKAAARNQGAYNTFVDLVGQIDNGLHLAYPQVDQREPVLIDRVHQFTSNQFFSMLISGELRQHPRLIVRKRSNASWHVYDYVVDPENDLKEKQKYAVIHGRYGGSPAHGAQALDQELVSSRKAIEIVSTLWKLPGLRPLVEKVKE